MIFCDGNYGLGAYGNDGLGAYGMDSEHNREPERSHLVWNKLKCNNQRFAGIL